MSPEALRKLLNDPSGSVAVGDGIREVLQASLHLTFWAVFVVSVLAVLLALAVPPVSLDRVSEAAAE